MFNSVILSALSAAAGMLAGAIIGYVYAYLSGLVALRRGVQLILREILDEMYLSFLHKPPTADQKRRFVDLYLVYETLGKNGVMDAKYKHVLRMKEKDNA